MDCLTSRVTMSNLFLIKALLTCNVEGRLYLTLSSLVLSTNFSIDRFSMIVFRRSFAVSLPPYALSNNLTEQKMAAFYTYVYRSLHICSDPSPSNELNFLKSLVLSRGCNPSAIDKAFDKVKKLKSSVCHSDSYLNQSFND